MWLVKLRLEIFAALLVVPACASDRAFGDEEGSGTSGGPIDACIDGESVVILDEAGRDTGFVRCPDGRVNRVAAVACASADVCQSDADCGPQQMCLCSDAAIFEVQELWGQRGCYAVACVDGDDCESGECGLAPTDDYSCGSRPALECRSSVDTCAGVDSCGGGPCGIVDGSFACTGFGCAGRPLLDAQQCPILASAVARDDWHRDLGEPTDGGLSAKQRQRLCAHWEQNALAEHASVASFARFALDLASLGAPADLMARTAQAMADEVEHARLCFGVAKLFADAEGDAARGPGPLAVASASMTHERRDLLARLIAEACIGETLAVAEAAAALSACADPRVEQVLRTIVQDETAHSALAWASLQWAMSKADAGERKWIADTLRQAVREQHQAIAHERQTSEPSHQDAALRHFGLLGSLELAEARAQALAEVVEPAVRVLLAGAQSSHRPRSRVNAAPG